MFINANSLLEHNLLHRYDKLHNSTHIMLLPPMALQKLKALHLYTLQGPNYNIEIITRRYMFAIPFGQINKSI